MAFPDDELAVGEQVLLDRRMHLSVLVVPVLVFVLVALFVLAVDRHPFAVSLVVLLGLWLVARPALRWLTTRYVITTRRVLVRRGVLTRRGRDVPLDRVVGVSYDRTLSDRLLGRGTLRVETASTAVVLHAVPTADHAHALLDRPAVGDV